MYLYNIGKKINFYNDGVHCEDGEFVNEEDY
jgi:hypothetical protein